MAEEGKNMEGIKWKKGENLCPLNFPSHHVTDPVCTFTNPKQNFGLRDIK